MASTTSFASLSSLLETFQDEMNKFNEEWTSKVDDSIVKERQALQQHLESLQAKEDELRIRETKLNEDDKKLKRRMEAFDDFALEEEERLEKIRVEYERKLELDSNEALQMTVVAQKVELRNLKNNVDSLGKFLEDLQTENDELRKKLASKREKEAAALQRELRLKMREEELANREEEIKLKEEEMAKREKSLSDEKKKLRKMREDVKMKEVQDQVEEDVENAEPSVWQPAEEYVTSLENDVSSDDDPDDQSRMKRALKILNVAAGKGESNCELAFSCSPRMIYEAKLAYIHKADINMIEVLAVGNGDSPVDAVWSACKSVQKMILDVSLDSESGSRLSLSSSSSSSSD